MLASCCAHVRMLLTAGGSGQSLRKKTGTKERRPNNYFIQRNCCTKKGGSEGLNGSLCSCVGPVVDIQMRSKLFRREKFVLSAVWPVLGSTANSGQRDLLFCTSVYDAVFVVRPSCNFRDGTLLKGWNDSDMSLFAELPYMDSYLYGLLHLVPADYITSMETSVLEHLLNESKLMKGGSQIYLGFASMWSILKSYDRLVFVSEVSQLCYGGVFRAVSF